VGAGVLLGILGGFVPPGFPNPDPIFQTIKCNFSHPFSDQTSKINTRFSDLAFRQKLCYHYLD